MDGGRPSRSQHLMPPHHDVRNDHRRQSAEARLAREPNKLWPQWRQQGDASTTPSATPPCSRSSCRRTAASTSSPTASNRASISCTVSLNAWTASFGAPQAVARSASCSEDKTRESVQGGPKRRAGFPSVGRPVWQENYMDSEHTPIHNARRRASRFISWGCRTIGRAVDLSSCRMDARGRLIKCAAARQRSLAIV